MAQKQKYTVVTKVGTFTRTTARTYTHVVIGRVVGALDYEQANKTGSFGIKPIEQTEFVALTWCGRADLAVKELTKFRQHPEIWSDIKAVDVATGEIVTL